MYTASKDACNLPVLQKPQEDGATHPLIHLIHNKDAKRRNALVPVALPRSLSFAGGIDVYSFFLQCLINHPTELNS